MRIWFLILVTLPRCLGTDVSNLIIGRPVTLDASSEPSLVSISSGWSLQVATGAILGSFISTTAGTTFRYFNFTLPVGPGLYTIETFVPVVSGATRNLKVLIRSDSPSFSLLTLSQLVTVAAWVPVTTALSTSSPIQVNFIVDNTVTGIVMVDALRLTKINPSATPSPSPVLQIVIDNTNPEFIVDTTNTDLVTVVGFWPSNVQPTAHGTTYLIGRRQTGAQTVTMMLPVAAGQYAVEIWFVEGPTNDRNVPIFIHNGVIQRVFFVDQTTHGSQWFQLAVISFQQTVVTPFIQFSTDATNGFVNVDAVRVRLPGLSSTPQVSPSATRSAVPVFDFQICLNTFIGPDCLTIDVSTPNCRVLSLPSCSSFDRTTVSNRCATSSFGECCNQGSGSFQWTCSRNINSPSATGSPAVAAPSTQKEAFFSKSSNVAWVSLLVIFAVLLIIAAIVVVRSRSAEKTPSRTRPNGPTNPNKQRPEPRNPSPVTRQAPAIRNYADPVVQNFPVSSSHQARSAFVGVSSIASHPSAPPASAPVAPKTFTSEAPPPNLTEHGLFGMPLPEAARYTDTRARVPAPISRCIDFLTQHVEASQLYTARGDPQKIRMYVQQWHRGEKVRFPKDESPYTVCGVLVEYIRRLPDTLFTTEGHDLLASINSRHSCSSQELKQQLQSLISKLPPCHLASAHLVFQHLHLVAARSNTVKATDLASIIFPTTSRAARRLIDNFPDYFAVETGNFVVRVDKLPHFQASVPHAMRPVTASLSSIHHPRSGFQPITSLPKVAKRSTVGQSFAMSTGFYGRPKSPLDLDY